MTPALKGLTVTSAVRSAMPPMRIRGRTKYLAVEDQNSLRLSSNARQLDDALHTASISGAHRHRWNSRRYVESNAISQPSSVDMPKTQVPEDVEQTNDERCNGHTDIADSSMCAQEPLTATVCGPCGGAGCCFCRPSKHPRRSRLPK